MSQRNQPSTKKVPNWYWWTLGILTSLIFLWKLVNDAFAAMWLD